MTRVVSDRTEMCSGATIRDITIKITIPRARQKSVTKDELLNIPTRNQQCHEHA
jgi:hypothetical protein